MSPGWGKPYMPPLGRPKLGVTTMSTATLAARPVAITAELLASGCTTTCSNTGGAHALIHAPLCGDYRAALDRVAALPYGVRNNELCSTQLRMAARYETVRPTWCIRGYWYLRNTMNLGNTWPAGRGQWATLQECMDAALEWCLRAPQYREALVYTSDLREAGITPL